jgi:hypothetical protein
MADRPAFCFLAFVGKLPPRPPCSPDHTTRCVTRLRVTSQLLSKPGSKWVCLPACRDVISTTLHARRRQPGLEDRRGRARHSLADDGRRTAPNGIIHDAECLSVNKATNRSVNTLHVVIIRFICRSHHGIIKTTTTRTLYSRLVEASNASANISDTITRRSPDKTFQTARDNRCRI